MHKIKSTIMQKIPDIFLVIESLGFGKVLRKVLRSIFIVPRQRLKVTDIKNLSRHIPLPIYFFITPELHKSNDWYGNATILKDYSGVDSNYAIKSAVEHGSSPSGIIFEQDRFSKFPAIITYSKERAHFLSEATGKKVFSIGPYIYYAQDLLNDSEYETEKKRLGKNLLVFTAHSSVDVKSDYNINNYCKEVVKVSKKFDTVRVCLYWRDISYGVDKIYRKYGFECVTAGDIFDPLFLPRLKTIIKCSTSTMSNSISTHIGYCVLLNKPHYYFDQKIHFSGNTQIIQDSVDLKDTQATLAIKKLFGKYSDYVTDDQRKIIAPIWGFDQLKTPHEMKKIFNECELTFRKKLG